MILFLAFVENFTAIFDSTNAYLAHQGDGPVDLRDTLQYKMLIMCGQFVKVNKRTRQQVVWVEESRSVMLTDEQKAELCTVMGTNAQVAENPNLMAIAMEFRLKPLLVSGNSVAAARQSDGESKAFKQLKKDCE